MPKPGTAEPFSDRPNVVFIALDRQDDSFFSEAIRPILTNEKIGGFTFTRSEYVHELLDRTDVDLVIILLRRNDSISRAGVKRVLDHFADKVVLLLTARETDIEYDSLHPYRSRILHRKFELNNSRLMASIIREALERIPPTTGSYSGELHLLADLDAVPASVVAELMGALDELHRAHGGGGLEIRMTHTGSAAAAGVRA
jgi:hypothetical protein